MAPLIDPMAGGSVLALPGTLEKAVTRIPNVDTVIEGHGDVNTWEGFGDYVQFNRALVDAAKAGMGQKTAAGGRRLAEAEIPRLYEGGTADGHGVRRHAVVARGDQRERRVPGVGPPSLIRRVGRFRECRLSNPPTRPARPTQATAPPTAPTWFSVAVASKSRTRQQCYPATMERAERLKRRATNEDLLDVPDHLVAEIVDGESSRSCRDLHAPNLYASMAPRAAR
jgi:hypothetical protein